MKTNKYYLKGVTTMKNLFDKIIKRRYYWILEERYIVEVLNVINSQQKRYIDQNMAVGNCLWANERTKWFIHFDASKEQWCNIVKELNAKGFELVIRNEPNNVYLIKRIEL